MLRFFNVFLNYFWGWIRQMELKAAWKMVIHNCAVYKTEYINENGRYTDRVLMD